MRKEKDGDLHVALMEGGKLIVVEVVPEYPVAPPKKGQRVKVWGIVREDTYHGPWWEIHPAFGIEEVK